MIKALIFDMDGTLYDERDFVVSGFREIAKHIYIKYGFDPDSTLTALVDDFNAGHRGNNLNLMCEKFGIPAQHVKDLIEIHRNHRPEIKLYPEVETTLSELKQYYKLGLLTDGWIKTQENKISALNIKHYFDAIMISDTLGKQHWKPSEKPYIKILNDLGVNPSEAAYIGDDPSKDFITAKKLGLYTIRVLRNSGEFASIFLDNEYEAHQTRPNLTNLKNSIPMDWTGEFHEQKN